jgi:hypothetical protein
MGSDFLLTGSSFGTIRKWRLVDLSEVPIEDFNYKGKSGIMTMD